RIVGMPDLPLDDCLVKRRARRDHSRITLLKRRALDPALFEPADQHRRAPRIEHDLFQAEVFSQRGDQLRGLENRVLAREDPAPNAAVLRDPDERSIGAGAAQVDAEPYLLAWLNLEVRIRTRLPCA